MFGVGGCSDSEAPTEIFVFTCRASLNNFDVTMDYEK